MQDGLTRSQSDFPDLRGFATGGIRGRPLGTGADACSHGREASPQPVDPRGCMHLGVDESRVRHMAIDGDMYRLPTKVRRSHAFPDLAHSSSLTGGLCVTLFNPADDAFPDQPAFSATLAHPDLLPRLEVAATRIGYGIF